MLGRVDSFFISRDRVGDAEPAAKVFKRVAERVERRVHGLASSQNSSALPFHLI